MSEDRLPGVGEDRLPGVREDRVPGVSEDRVPGVSEDPFSGAAVTALGLAAARSVESGRPDRLIEDPLARHLFLAAGRALPMRLEWPADGKAITATEALHLHGSRYIGLRTRFYDDFVTRAAADGVRQVVLLGAGLDTRAYRLELPPTLRLFELDRTGLLAFKRKAIAAAGAEPAVRLQSVGLDIRDDWAAALREAGFTPARPSCMIAEGLLAYLAPQEQDELLESVSALSAPGSWFAADRIAGDPHAGRRLEGISERSGIDLRGLLAGGESRPLEALTAHGWLAEEQTVATIAELYGRDLSDPFTTPDSNTVAEPPWLESTFITARRSTARSEQRRGS